jgi:hypothetical protein
MGTMAGMMSRILAAIGIGGNKAEADVSYDPALDENAGGGEKGAGGSDIR